MLSRFPVVMPQCVEAVLAVAAALRHVSQSSGDLTWRDVNAIQDGLHRAKETTAAALAEGQKAPAAAEAFMASIGGPATLAEFAALAADIEAKATAWNVRLAAALAELTADEVIFLGHRGEGAAATRHVQYRHFLPARVADPLRQSDELAALVAAFVAVGG